MEFPKPQRLLQATAASMLGLPVFAQLAPRFEEQLCQEVPAALRRALSP